VGLCGGRKNIGGKTYAINYGEVVSIAMDPIEKKPLYHFHPGLPILSIAPNTCNMRCPHCQNYVISQKVVPTEYISPEDMVEIAVQNNSSGIAYTYTEPLTWFEYLLDVARLAKERGLYNVLVTNGLIEEDPLLELLPFVDAMNVDLKSMDREYYAQVLGGDLDTVLRTITISHEIALVEVTNLVIPTQNDSPELIHKLIDWVADLDPEIPLHFSKYFPHWKVSFPPTPASTLEWAYEEARKKLSYVYVGNVEIPGASNTFCPDCGNLLVERRYFYARVVGLDGRKCRECGREINIVL